ncbi:hypothetical protein [Bosea sp. ANAM02]|uniref:hypothetical protein n=1 Tax=Bosea sp. ANAM02 TaxID=2020412 RepID=UPI001564B827|nr:hypothetical protein [Bosea sp. ANAM02]
MSFATEALNALKFEDVLDEETPYRQFPSYEGLGNQGVSTGMARRAINSAVAGPFL